MRTTHSAADEAFRAEVRDWLETHLTPRLREGGRKRTSVWPDPDVTREWQQLLHAKGWVAPDWPVEYGGTDWTITQRYIYAEECARVDAPIITPMGVRMCGPMLIGYGTEEQKAYYLPRILSGEDIWCQGYSEPGAGSDLASLKCQAISDGDDYIVNGTKIWTSYAQHANKIFMLVRTNNDGRPQQGITFLLADMDTPGISIRPIINLEGVHELNQVFFDNVRVPKANRVGAENDGWTVAKYLLEFERFGMSSIELNRTLTRVHEIASATPADGGTVADDVGFQAEYRRLRVENMSLRALEQRIMSDMSAGQRPGTAANVLKTRGAEILHEAHLLAIRTLGWYAVPYEPELLQVGHNQDCPGHPDSLVVMATYLNERHRTVAGGSSEIQRNVIAKVVLGL